jgi:hypothetical protein
MKDTIIKSWLKNYESDRLSRFSRYTDRINFLLKDDQWDDDDIDSEKVYYEDERLVVNQVSEFIEFYISKLFPVDPLTNTVSVGVSVKNESPSNERKYEMEILKNYELNRLVKKLLEQAQNYLVGGNGSFYYPFDDGIHQTRLFSIDPTSVYGPEFDDMEIKSVAFVENINEEVKKSFFTQMVDKMKGDSGLMSRKVTFIDKDEIVILENDNVVDRQPNNLGFVPFSWLENRPIAHQHEGRSEVSDSDINLQKEYNKRLTNYGQRAKKNTRAKFALYTDLEIDKVLSEKDGNDIFKLSPKDRAEYLMYAENQEILSYLSKIDNHLRRKRGMNDATDGILKSNVSGLSMAYSYAPLIDKIGLRRIEFDYFLKNFNKAILINCFGDSASTVQSEPVYNSILSPDQDKKVERIVSMRSSNPPLISIDKALDVLHGTEIAQNEKKKVELEQKIKDTFLSSKMSNMSPRSNLKNNYK